MNILNKINQEITKQTLVLDNQIAKVEKDIPTFKAINVGAIIYSDNLKKCIQNEKEHIKVFYDLLKQTEDAIKLFEFNIKVSEDVLKFEGKGIWEHSYTKEQVAIWNLSLSQLKKDRDQLKLDIAKGLRRFDLITNEIEERKKRNN
jgi:hypothetical protein|tara:strand:+ start:161 stop:598 length:438 start_codon:yes stop_codon:yes gene_type:complete